MIQQYHTFLEGKASYGANDGFAPLYLPPEMFDFQTHLADWSIRKGRAAVFADCGMGKTLIQLVWADNVVKKTNKPVLLLSPLAVSRQTLAEAHKFGIDATIADPARNPTTIQIINYEQLHKYDAHNYAGVVCDESSILKNFNGAYKAEVTEFMRLVPYRSLFTATAAPNDWPELGTSSEALGYYGHMDMLSKFFTTKSGAVSSLGNSHRSRDKFYLRSYARQDFWRWVSSWARAARMPSDLGFEDNGFVLPKLIENDIEVKANRPPDGMLFEMEAVDFFEEREAIRRTVDERAEAAAECVSRHDISVVWCHTNAEADALRRAIPEAIEVSGSDPIEKKEEVADWFVNGSDQKRVLISKPTIFGFGMNWQHCSHSVYFPTHSYEQYYQATRRIWRFGQSNDVIIDRIYTNGGKRMLDNLNRKSRQAAKMFEQLVKFMNDEINIKNEYKPRKVGLPQWLTK